MRWAHNDCKLTCHAITTFWQKQSTRSSWNSSSGNGSGKNSNSTRTSSSLDYSLTYHSFLSNDYHHSIRFVTNRICINWEKKYLELWHLYLRSTIRPKHTFNSLFQFIVFFRFSVLVVKYCDAFFYSRDNFARNTQWESVCVRAFGDTCQLLLTK